MAIHHWQGILSLDTFKFQLQIPWYLEGSYFLLALGHNYDHPHFKLVLIIQILIAVQWVIIYIYGLIQQLSAWIIILTASFVLLIKLRHRLDV